jgi:hypothetical protein
LTAWNVKHAQLSDSDAFVDEVDVDFDVLRSTMMDGVAGHVDRRDVVAERHRCLVDAALEFARSWRSQAHSAAALATPRYSASALDRDTVGWRLLDHETRDAPRKMQ